MIRKVVVMTIAVALASCSKPTDIMLGPKPLEQLAEQGNRFKALPEKDRLLLAQYLMAGELGKALGADVKPVVGRTVGEVLVDARAWQAKVAAEAAARQVKSEADAADQTKRNKEAEVLREKMEVEQKAMIDKIAQAVTVVVVDKKTLPKDYGAGRYSAIVQIIIAVENKSDKTIREIKGDAIFRDATGDKIGSLPIDVDASIAPGKTLRTDMGHGWRLNEIRNGEIEKIAARDFSSMRTSFEPSAVAFDGGEVLRIPE